MEVLNRESAIQLSLRQQIKEDYIANGKDWTQPGFQAVALHRFGVWVSRLRIRLFRAPLDRVYRFLYVLVRNFYSIELPRGVIVGRRLRIGHQGGIVVHWKAQIGDDCLIRQNVTIGALNDETALLAPKLGNAVEIGCGAAIIGGITIGDHVRIGPNAVVTTNIPGGVAVLGPDSRVAVSKKFWSYNI